MKRTKQESILSSFSRQHKPSIKRSKTAHASANVVATSSRKERAERRGTRGETPIEDDDGSVLTDVDMFSSQEDGTERLRRATDRRGRALSDVVSLGVTQEMKWQETTDKIALHPKKGVKDTVHGMIMLEPICWRLIDTVQFQRLRHLHQLGAARHVYIGATHSRFEHCLGVAYLAERMMTNIQLHQPYLPITPRDILCIKIAGLCHDLGHGPFSHVFDGIYMKQLRRRKLVDDAFDWTHEQGSLDMFDHLLRANNIDVEEYGLEGQDVAFIKELIYGVPLPGEKTRIGRPDPEQHFLYDVVNNAKSGLDVDKLDYFLRDARHTGAKASCDVELIIQNARVLVDRDDPERKLSICFPEKLAGKIMQAFRTRFELHQAVYQHKNIRAAEYMICDALLAADEHLKIKGRRISEIVHHMDAYQHLDDRVLARIEESEGDELSEARAILKRMVTRPFYECVGKTKITIHSREKNEDTLLDEILRSSKLRSLWDERENVIAEFVRVHYGKGEQDPLQSVRFYSKASNQDSTCYRVPQEIYEMYLPASFQEWSIRLFVKEPRLVTLVREAFEYWSEKFNKSRVVPVVLSAE
ncbi:hypothetical protein Poli38472_014349 [Pythium oligandrum]|uniref:HD/PDEase domain-containing protein n=1 Tax=Pythium oligandrum TaxID=41045 RepID=A0A8K1C7A9_PYTOL|nr:hypothetical protein Poli38472_014349 [Pythium oligandrum]|eukprot:TMW57746.1 hypothetical protein Poli38472_014349 [Pythium oligandrum]